VKKLIFCLALLLVSIPLLAGVTGIGIGVHGGIEMIDIEGVEIEPWPEIGGSLDFSLPGIPVGLRGGYEYTWKGYDVDVTATIMLISLAGQYNVDIPGVPLSFYIGAGGELSIQDTGVEAVASETDLGFIGYAGANYNMGMMGLFAEVGYGLYSSANPSENHIPIRGGIKFSL
jgi:hypothetical protein